jgi:hypothetical protein
LIASIAAALAGCSGRGTIPEAGFSTPNVVVADQACNVSTFWYLQGSCKRVSLTAAGGMFVLLPYKGFKHTLTLGKNTAAGKDTFFFSDATGNGDISGTNGGAKFVPYSKSVCVSGFHCAGKAVLYFSNINKGKEVGLLGASSATLTNPAGFPGKTLCFPAFSTPKGWLPDTKLGVKPRASSFKIDYPADKLFLPTGQLVVAYVCT